MGNKGLVEDSVVLAFQNGDQEAFEKIYKAYFNKILFFAYTRTNNFDMAKDIVQNTFIAAYKNISKLKRVEAFRVWIMKIAYCECQNMFRKNKIKGIEMPEYMDIDSYEDEKGPSEQQRVSDIVLQEIVASELKMMDNKLKDVAILKYVEGLNEKEISYILKVPTGTVKSRAYRAKVLLQEGLRRNGITPATYRTYSFSIPTLLVSAYAYMQTQVDVAIPDYQGIIDAASKASIGGGILAGINAVAVQRAAIGMVILVSGVATGFFLTMSKTASNNITPLPLEIKAPPTFTATPCQIRDITYNQAFTNQDIELNVQVTNEDYDEILVNNSTSLLVHENGDYVVQVIKDGQAIDEQHIKITNIDKEAPQYLSYKNDGATYFVYMNDGISKIDPASIKYYKNGQLQSDFIYDEANQMLYFTYEDFSSNVFEVLDHAGNETVVTVVSSSLENKKN